MTDETTDLAGPCARCGRSINDPIHMPPHGRQVEDVGIGHAWAASRPLSDEAKRETTASDLVVALQMWDYTRAEADDILRRARRLVKTSNAWTNPLEGTGLKPVAGSGGLKQQ